MADGTETSLNHLIDKAFSNMPVQILATVLLIVTLITGYLFLAHSIEKTRMRRRQLINALRARRSVFRDLATGFPSGFLTHDLSAYLYKTLIDCCAQLTRLEPRDLSHKDQLESYTNLLAAQKNHTTQSSIRLNDPQKAREARQLLQELYKFLKQQEALNLIDHSQASTLTYQLNRLMTQLFADTYIFNAQEAQKIGKVRLAYHYFSLARKALLTEKKDASFISQIVQLETTLKNLEEVIANSTEEKNRKASEAIQQKSSTADQLNDERKKLGSNTEDWKKKQIYD